MLKKEKYLCEISMFAFTKKFFTGLPNLDTQITHAQDRYTTIQMDLKYSLLL